MEAVHLPWIKIWIFDVVPERLKEKKYNLSLLAKFKVNHDTYPCLGTCFLKPGNDLLKTTARKITPKKDQTAIVFPSL